MLERRRGARPPRPTPRPTPRATTIFIFSVSDFSDTQRTKRIFREKAQNQKKEDNGEQTEHELQTSIIIFVFYKTH